MTNDVPGPYIIGATGGSGTRVVARIARAGGLYIGTNLNVSEDALDFGAYSDRWIDKYIWGSSPSLQPQADMVADLKIVLDDHLRSMPAGARAWGWKEPRGSFLLPFFHSQFPDMKFLHVVRDGRDMAFSKNQNQLRKHGHTVLGEAEAGWSEPLRSIALWSRHNLRVAEYGETHMAGGYLRIRFEDVCATPVATIERIFDFFGLQGDPERLAQNEVASPDSLGRWQGQDPVTLDAFRQLAWPALAKFGYRTASSGRPEEA